uniref:Uncharacterized protein n=1 Tax=Arundo donax TaxID=35708 RepID=A0A0A9E747_ARUDO
MNIRQDQRYMNQTHTFTHHKAKDGLKLENNRHMLG